MIATVIDEIRPQKGHQVGLYADGELVCSLDSGLAAEKGLKTGEYTGIELIKLMRESELRRAKSKALYLLGFRDYSARDMEARLRQDFDAGAAEEAASYLVEIGAVDDARYAENMIRHLIDRKHYGRRRILRELAAKGVDSETAQQALSASELDEEAAISSLLEGKFSRDLGDEKGVRRTMATLQRYGYETGDILRALRRFSGQ